MKWILPKMSGINICIKTILFNAATASFYFQFKIQYCMIIVKYFKGFRLD